METLRKASFFALAALVVTTTCCAQTAEDIVAKNIQAVGGQDLIASTKSMVITSNLEVMGNDVPTITTILAGKGFKSETDFQGTKIVQVITDHNGWAVNPMAGQSTPTAMSDADVKTAQTQLNISPLSNYAANGGKLELLGKDSADYKVKLTNANGYNATFYINMKTYFIDKEDVHITVQGQQVDATVLLSDYRKVDNGLLIPYKIERDMPQYTINLTHQKVEVNKEIDPAIFEMPK
jgi:outer membrane lipoprotein-sorting protein